MTRPALFCALIIALPSLAAEPPYVVDRADIVQIVRERGAVDAASAVDIVAPPGGSKDKPLVIKSVIPEGTIVKKGDRLLEFDDGFARERLNAQNIVFDQSGSVLAMTQRELKIAVLVNDKELRSATAGVELAELVLKNTAEADALTKKRMELKVRHAEVALERAKIMHNAENSELSKLGVQAAEIEREAALLETKQFELSIEPGRKQGQLRIREARDEMELTKLRGDQRRAHAEAAAQAAHVATLQQRINRDAAERELANCVVTAPGDGIVIYATADMRRAGPSGVLAQGEPVRAGQPLLRIPDLKRLKIDTRVHENQVSQLRPGQVVRVHIDAFPDKVIEGRVESISPTASPADFRDRDVKVYPVSIALPGADISLKPGMTAEAQIYTAVAKNALRVPAAAVVRTARKAVCAVDAPGGMREATVVTGISDGKFIEIREGLKEGDKVLIPAK